MLSNCHYFYFIASILLFSIFVAECGRNETCRERGEIRFQQIETSSGKASGTFTKLFRRNTSIRHPLLLVPQSDANKFPLIFKNKKLSDKVYWPEAKLKSVLETLDAFDLQTGDRIKQITDIGNPNRSQLFIVATKSNKKYVVKITTAHPFLREFQAYERIKELKSPHFPLYTALFQSNDEMGCNLIVMNYISEYNLNDVFVQRKRKITRTIPELAAQLAFAINLLHINGVVHRDIKLENIMLDPMERIVIIDFDCSCIISNKNERICGSAGSMISIAPEVIEKRSYTYKCDWYSYGITLFGMLTGIWKRREELKQYLMDDKIFSTSVPNANARSLIKKLLLNEDQRLSSYEDIKNEPYFQLIDWKSLEEM